jgi:hypothetical protein
MVRQQLYAEGEAISDLRAGMIYRHSAFIRSSSGNIIEGTAHKIVMQIMVVRSRHDHCDAD